MKVPPAGPWAKLAPRGDPTEWHPLLDHGHDVAACLESMLAIPVVGARLARLSGREGLSPSWVSRLVVLAFLHDFGKANHAFQERTGGHINEAAPLVLDEALAMAAGLGELDTWFASADSCVDAWIAILSHHGRPPDLTYDGAGAMRRYWQKGATLDPVAAVADLVAEARRAWPRAFAAGGEKLPVDPRFWHFFLGLLQLADWLGSDNGVDAFPFSKEGDRDRRSFSPGRAAELVRKTGLEISALRSRRASVPDFSAVSHHLPSPIQRAVGEAEGPIVVMEAETGSGKTEAALYRFARLFVAGRVDGLYFALPTRVAASQIFARVRSAVERLFPDESARPAVIRALPGDAGADGALVRRLPDFAVQWSDDADDVERRRRWAAEGPKRFLAATVAVGTIDQALLGAANVRHAQMRSACLARSLLVVDEVHASDHYMSRLLENLLDQHLKSGGEALLLSATLGADARTRLMLGHTVKKTRLGKLSPTYDDAVTAPYPACSVLAGGRIEMQAAPGRGAGKTVSLAPSAAIADPEAVARMALEAARSGARVLVVRNTVDDAVATRAALEALAPGDPVQFTLQGVATLHHGRFAREDRRRLDAEVEARLAKRGTGAGGLVVVGTHTLEISLDIDSDLLITDLAPADVLLQRIGRLHRHDNARPPGFERPLACVLVPESFDAALASVGREKMSGPHGLGSVYQNLPALAATMALIGDGATWAIPAMNRQLVEAATHPERLTALVAELATEDPRWTDAAARAEGRSRAQAQTADYARLDWDAPMREFRPDESVSTRLGGRDVELVFDPAPMGPFGTPVTRLVVPHHMTHEGGFEPDGFAEIAGGFSFRIGAAQLVYDGYGLRQIRRE